jgi:hypothetical protein
MSDRDVLLEMFRKRLQPEVLDHLTAEDRLTYNRKIEALWNANPHNNRAYTYPDDQGSSLEVHDGYVGFVAEFTFDDEGNLSQVAAWE